MFKRQLNLLPSPLNDLFTVNNTQHNHFTRQHADLHVNTGVRENVYRLFSFQGIYIWNHISKQIPINVSYACYKNLYKNYIYKITIYSIELSNFSNHYIQHSMFQNRKLYLLIVILSLYISLYFIIMCSNNTIGAQSECDIIYVDYVYNGVPGRYFSYYSIYWNIFVVLGLL